MKSESDSRCRFCGQSNSDAAIAGACPYCLLQLGLSRPGSRSEANGGGALSLGGRAKSVADRFVQQGVLPQFGDYELESEIARGGMGVVYRARQRSLNRTVAIKMILAGQLASPESVQRFRLEAEAAARLHHPGIVPIYEIGEFETQHFFSMKLIEGVSLAECLADFRVPTSGTQADRREQEVCIAELMGSVARALEFAHQRGVLHRDLKPSNILIDEEGMPHLTDFGLAKLTGREASGITLSTAVLGTPGYLAPEQAAGKTELVTTAADVYGLGATLYELLTGHPPFVGSTSLETMWMAIERNPKPPRQINSSVHRDLETIALRCLEKVPEKRYPSAAAVAEELERFVRREPIQARPVSRVEHAWRWCQRNPGSAIMGLTLLIAILAGSGTAFWQWGRAEVANVRLTENVDHLEWAAIDTMLESGQSSLALAKVAALVRNHPDDRKAAMFAMSVLEQRRFPVPAAPQIRHTSGSELTVARISPSGNRIVTASFDKTARIWDATTSEPAAPPLQHQGTVTWAEFSPDGKIVATCSEDKSVRLWDVAMGGPVGTPYIHEAGVIRVQFSPDGRRLLTHTASTVVILDGQDGHLLVGPLKHAGRILSARIVADGSAFFTAVRGTDISQVQLRDMETGLDRASLQTAALRAADISDDLSRLATIEGQGHAWVADFPSGVNRKEIVSRDGLFGNATFDPSGNFLALSSLNQWVQVWDARTQLPVSREFPHYYLIAGATFLSENRLLTWALDSQAQVWDISDSRAYCEPIRNTQRVEYAESGKLAGTEVFLTTLSHLKSRSESTQTGKAQLWRVYSRPSSSNRLIDSDFGAFDCTTMSADGRLMALGKTSQEVLILDTATFKQVCPPLSVKGGPWGISFSPDASRVAVSTSRGQVSVFAILEGQRIAPPVELPTTYQPLEMTRDGRYFATGSVDGFARFWDMQSGKLIHEMRHGSEINSIDFSPDGHLLATAGEDRVLNLWDTRTGKLVRSLTGHKNEILSVSFSPDGRRLVSASLDFSARIWDPSTGLELFTLPHQGEVLDAVFSPDGRWVATGARDRTAVIWDPLTGLPHSRNLLHEQAVRNVQFTPDSQSLLTLDFLGLRLWDVATSHPLTVHLRHPVFGGTGFQRTSSRPSFTPDGLSILTGNDSYQARLLHLSSPPMGAPEWFPELLESIAGQRFVTSSDRPEAVPSEQFLVLKRQLQTSTDTGFYTRWARRWLFEQE
ncbi:MAG: protein kinase [Planctomycetota bacterium]